MSEKRALMRLGMRQSLWYRCDASVLVHPRVQER